VKRTLYEAEHELFRQSFRSFVDTTIVPLYPDWEAAGVVDRSLFLEAGRLGSRGRGWTAGCKRSTAERPRSSDADSGSETWPSHLSTPRITTSSAARNSASEREVSPYPGFLSTGSVLTGPRLGDPDLRRPNCGLPDTESVLLNPGYATPLFQWWVDGCHFSAHRNCRRRSRHHR
jgi:hypothetical protein